MKYFDFFNFKEDPFSGNPDPEFFFPAQRHAEALESMKYFMNSTESIMLILGDAGTGKTTLMKTFIKEIKDNPVPIPIYNSTLPVDELIFHILSEVGKMELSISSDFLSRFSKTELFLLLEKELRRLYQLGQKFIVLVDECQDLSSESLLQIKHLSNLEYEKDRLLKFVLFGLQSFEKFLKKDENIQINQRVSLRVYLGRLKLEEVENFINFRLNKVGGNRVKFEKSALKAIYKASKGIPRLVNLLCSRALMICHLENSYIVENFHVKVAKKHLMLD